MPLGAIIALLIATLLNQKIAGLSIWRTIYYLPTVISGVAVSLLWLQILIHSAGLLNNFLALFHIAGPSWLYDSTWALPSLIMMSVWGVGANMLLYLAGLQGIPTQLYEAATIDGANAWHRFRAVTIPMLSPTIFFNVTISLIGAFQFFTQSFIMTNGGPNNATLSMVLYLYNKAFGQIRFGYASAVAWVLFAIIISFTLLFRNRCPDTGFIMKGKRVASPVGQISVLSDQWSVLITEHWSLHTRLRPGGLDHSKPLQNRRRFPFYAGVQNECRRCTKEYYAPRSTIRDHPQKRSIMAQTLSPDLADRARVAWRVHCF